MSIFRKPAEKLQQDIGEEQLYAIAADEVANREMRKGLYAKALAQTQGDEQKARARYIQLRVESLRTERAAIGQVIAEQDAATRVPPPRKAASTKSQKLGNVFGYVFLALVLIFVVPWFIKDRFLHNDPPPDYGHAASPTDAPKYGVSCKSSFDCGGRLVCIQGVNRCGDYRAP